MHDDVIRRRQTTAMSLDLSDPAQYQHAYEQHNRSVYGVAFRVLGDAAQAR